MTTWTPEILDEAPLCELRAAIARKMRLDLATPDERRKVEAALQMAADAYSLPVDEILGSRRDEWTIAARHAVYVGLFKSGMRPARIALAMGHDRTRVLYALRKAGIHWKGGMA